MARIGTAFVEIQPDFSAFDRLVERKLAGSFKGTGEQAGKNFSDGFNERASGLLLPFKDATKDVDKATAAVNRNTRAAKAAGDALNVATRNVSAFGKDGEASFDGSRKAAEEAAAAIRQEFANLTPQKKFDLKLAGANAEVEQIRAHLKALSQEKPTLEVRVATAKAIVDLDRAEAKAKEVAAQRPTITVDVDQSAFSRVKNTARELFNELGGASGGGGVGGALTRVSAGFFSFGSSLGPVLIAAGALAVTIGVSLAGALAALAASFGAAILGAAALGAALAAVAGPAVALGVLVGSRLTKIFEALKAQDSAAGSSAAGSQAAAVAAQQLASAERSLTEATRQAGLARASAFREMQDAAEKASDAIRGVSLAEESLDQARLNTDKAKLALAQFREEAGATGQAFGAVFQKFTDVAVDTSGLKKALANANAATGGSLDQSQELELRQKILDVRQARLQEKEATDGVSDAQTAATRAQQDNNKFKREGIRASESYRAALRSVESATLAVTAAQRQSDAGTSAQGKAASLVGKLDKAERGFLTTLKRVRTELRGAFSPATDAVINGLNKALGRVPQLINPLRGAFRRLGEAAGDSLDKVSADIVKPKTVASFRRFTDTAARLASPITDGLLSLFHIFLNIANAALPHLVSGTRSVAGQLKKWDIGTSNAKEMSKSIGGLVGHLKTWLGVGAAIGDVFLAFLESAAGPGQSLAESIKNLAERTATWLRSTEGREQLKQFFKDTIAFAKDFAGFMAVIIIATVKFGQTAARIFAQVTDKIGGPQNAAKVLLATLGALAALKFAKGLIGGLRTLSAALGVTRKAATLLHASWNAGALAAARERAVLIASRAAAIAAGLATKAFAAAQLLLNIALRANPIGLVVTALVALGIGLVAAYKHSETFRRIVDGAFTGVKTVALGAIRLILGAIDRLLGGFSSVASGLSHLPLIGNKFKGAADAIDHAREKLRGFADSLNAISKIKDLKVLIDVDLTADMKRLLRNLDNKKVTSTIRKTPPVPLHRATGGPIPGTGHSDTIPLLGTPGEFMMREPIVRRIGMGVMADINAGRLDPRIGYQPGQQPTIGVVAVRGPKFATGGPVGATAGTGTGTTIVHNNHITVPGGGQPDALNLSVQLARLSERRTGGDPGNW